MYIQRDSNNHTARSSKHLHLLLYLSNIQERYWASFHFRTLFIRRTKILICLINRIYIRMIVIFSKVSRVLFLKISSLSVETCIVKRSSLYSCLYYYHCLCRKFNHFNRSYGENYTQQ